MFKSALEQLGVEPEQVGWGTRTPSTGVPKYMACIYKTAECGFSLSGRVAGR